MIDWIETHSQTILTLDALAKQIGYSKFYCSSQFQKIVGMTIKKYIAGRRLCAATIEIRDTNHPIIAIALKFGYSSQGTLTRVSRMPMDVHLRHIGRILFQFRYQYTKSS